jgi:hypothetical protein
LTKWYRKIVRLAGQEELEWQLKMTRVMVGFISSVYIVMLFLLYLWFDLDKAPILKIFYLLFFFNIHCIYHILL